MGTLLGVRPIDSWVWLDPKIIAKKITIKPCILLDVSGCWTWRVYFRWLSLELKQISHLTNSYRFAFGCFLGGVQQKHNLSPKKHFDLWAFRVCSGVLFVAKKKLGSLEGEHSKSNIWMFPEMVVPAKHPKMIIFSRKNHGCWVPPF